MNIKDVEKYVEIIIPNIEKQLVDKNKSNSELLELYNLYEDVLIMIAPYNFHVYNKALEFHEDKTNINKGFYHRRHTHIYDLFESLNQMEMYDDYDMLLVSMPPRIGKTTTGIRFLSWIMGKYP